MVTRSAFTGGRTERLDKLYDHLDHVSSGGRLSRDHKDDLQKLFEDIYPLLETQIPKNFRGATGRTALNAYLLLLARKSLGKDYIKTDARLNQWSRNLAFELCAVISFSSRPKVFTAA
jgi:hypothetical protein